MDGMDGIFPLTGQVQARRKDALVDEPVDLSRAPRVEGDVALADARLLLQQTGPQQRLPHLRRQRPVVAGEATREVLELGVVAAPLAHPVEALEDAAGDPAAGVGIVVRAGRARGGGAAPDGPEVPR